MKIKVKDGFDELGRPIYKTVDTDDEMDSFDEISKVKTKVTTKKKPKRKTKSKTTKK